jgi:hypothetical protein
VIQTDAQKKGLAVMASPYSESDASAWCAEIRRIANDSESPSSMPDLKTDLDEILIVELGIADRVDPGVEGVKGGRRHRRDLPFQITSLPNECRPAWVAVL